MRFPSFPALQTFAHTHTNTMHGNLKCAARRRISLATVVYNTQRKSAAHQDTQHNTNMARIYPVVVRLAAHVRERWRNESAESSAPHNV